MHNEYALRVAKVLRNSKYVVAFTGAGISVESGIPAFRGAGGIWDKYDPRLLEIDFFVRKPEKSWVAIKEIFFQNFGAATPNPAHLTLARWQSAGILKRIITQNIDNLHHQAGSKDVIEFHGNTRQLICLECQELYPLNPILLSPPVPVCSKCGGLLKPDFVFFGEGIPTEAYVQAINEADKCDCMLIIGTSGEVYPANQLPYRAASKGAFIIEINKDTSNYTGKVCNLSVHLPSGEFLPLVDHHLNLLD